MAQRLGIAMIFVALAAYCQPPAARFEVASVKKAESGGPPGDIPRNMDPSPGHFAMRNVPLRYCLEWAYSLHDYEIAARTGSKAKNATTSSPKRPARPPTRKCAPCSRRCCSSDSR